MDDFRFEWPLAEVDNTSWSLGLQANHRLLICLTETRELLPLAEVRVLLKERAREKEKERGLFAFGRQLRCLHANKMASNLSNSAGGRWRSIFLWNKLWFILRACWADSTTFHSPWKRESSIIANLNQHHQQWAHAHLFMKGGQYH